MAETTKIFSDNFIDEEIFDISDIEDIVPIDNSKEIYDFNFEREDKNKSIPELHIDSIQQQNENISYDYIKIKLSLIHADDVNFSVNTSSFFRSRTAHIPATNRETAAYLLNNENRHCQQMTLTEQEQARIDSGELSEQEFRLSKLRFPNAKPFYDTNNHRIGLGHLYFNNGEFICIITGKIVSTNGVLGVINRNNIDIALNTIKSTGLVDFDNFEFRAKAQILSTHVTNDLTTPNINANVRAFSSFLPMRTDKYNILKYGNSGYEILARGKQSKSVPHYEFCIYNKDSEIREHNKQNYIKNIGEDGITLANNTLRMELRLLNFSAIRKFLSPNNSRNTITLNELLESPQRPIIEMLRLLNITTDNLRKSRDKYILMLEDKKLPTQAKFERMQGLIKLLEQNDYNLDKVRSYIEVETGVKTHSTYFSNQRTTLQQYLACYMPQTIARMTELLENLTY